METNVKDNIWIKSFNSEQEFKKDFLKHSTNNTDIFHGEICDIDKNIFEMCFELHPNSDPYNPMWFDYSDPTCNVHNRRSNYLRTDYTRTMLNAIKSATGENIYCYIYKINNAIY